MIWQSVLVVVICYLYIYLYFSYIYYLFLLLPWLWWIKIIKTRSWWSVYVVTGSELCTTMLLCNKTTANFYLSLQFMRSGASSKWSFERSGVIWCRTSLKRKSADNLLMTAMDVRHDSYRLSSSAAVQSRYVDITHVSFRWKMYLTVQQLPSGASTKGNEGKLPSFCA